MADLSIESFWHCETAESWEMTVQGKTGTYVVRFDRHSHRNHSVQFDYSCTCPAYRFKGTCKHIEAVKATRCGWMQYMDGGEIAHNAAGEPVCPKCGGPVSAMRWAV
jgi:hypothetical protein